MRRSVEVACAVALGIVLCASSGAAAMAAVPATSAVPAWGTGPVLVVWPGQSIHAAVNRARPGDTVLIKPGVYRQDALIRKDRITLLGDGDSWHAVVLRPPRHASRNLCNTVFGPTGVCIFGKRVDPKTGRSSNGCSGTRCRICSSPASAATACSAMARTG